MASSTSQISAYTQCGSSRAILRAGTARYGKLMVVRRMCLMRSPGSSRPGRAAGERSCAQPKNGTAAAEERSQLRRESMRECSHGEGGGLRSSAKSVINNLSLSGYARRMKATFFLSLILCASVFAAPSQKAVRERVGEELPSLLKLYQHLHANPEISFQEKETAKTLAAELG